MIKLKKGFSFASLFQHFRILRIFLLSLTIFMTTGITGNYNQPGEIILARLKYGGGGDWYVGPTSLPNLARGLNDRTNVRASTVEKAIGPGSPDFFNYPFLYLTGHGNVYFTNSETKRIRTHLLNGGFLFANDSYGFDNAFRRELKKIFPEYELTPLPSSHPIYNCHYRLKEGLPKIHQHDGKPPVGYGLFVGGRMLVFYNYSADIGDGLENAGVHNDPPETREKAMQMAINAVVYCLLN